jgi:hypothetical protein
LLSAELIIAAKVMVVMVMVMMPMATDYDHGTPSPMAMVVVMMVMMVLSELNVGARRSLLVNHFENRGGVRDGFQQFRIGVGMQRVHRHRCGMRGRHCPERRHCSQKSSDLLFHDVCSNLPAANPRAAWQREKVANGSVIFNLALSHSATPLRAQQDFLWL